MRAFLSADPPLELDACKPCGMVWFDPQEFEDVPESGVTPPDQLNLLAREALALHKVKQIAEQARAADPTPDEGWKTIPALFGFPVESDTNPVTRMPWATWSLTAIILMVSLWAFSDLRSAVERFGLIPAEFWRYGGATSLTSFFLHAGVFHLVGNLYFLLIFGDNVEDYLGRWRYLGLILAATLGGDLLHVLIESRSTVPCIGASGGISGVIAFYALQFPRARLGFLLLTYFWRYHWLQLPAWGAFILWVLLQIWISVQQNLGFSNVSGAAHLGGAVVGFLAWLLWKRLETKPAQ
jgi:membrane associated rhomboid family serine protease